ncbi:MAG TPA: hypothetical protein VHK27_13740 [Gammaproteobacteria bacterium]|nr:hypothetical protein [Gammaproteobacteria bacterium]
MSKLGQISPGQMREIIQPLADIAGVEYDRILSISIDPYGAVIRYWGGFYDSEKVIEPHKIDEIMLKMKPDYDSE